MSINKKGTKLSCFQCSPPTPVSVGKVNDVIHVGHIRHQHLYPYKPFSCSSCDQSFAVQLMLSSHCSLIHGDKNSQGTDQQYRGSKYLDVLGSLMKQCNVYSSQKNECLSVELLESVKQQSLEPSETPPEVGIPAVEHIANPQHLEPPQTQTPPESKEADIPQLEQSMGPERSKQKPQQKAKEQLCRSCNKTFFSPRILRMHQQSKCSKDKKMVKAKKLVAAQKLKQRAKLQAKTGGRAKCSTCGQLFPTRSDVIQHRVKVHRTHIKITEAKKFYRKRQYCMKCERCLCASSSALQHLAIFHLKKPMVACSRCNFTHWCNISNIKQHIARAHKGGGAKVIDNRYKFMEELMQLKNTMIKKVADC